jgi:transglutaminase-like putative cysteine protease
MSAPANPLRRIPIAGDLLHYINSQPIPKAEESIPFRVLVQLLVFIGIIATDVAAGITNSFWAIPLSAIGAWWGWKSRHQRNVLVKFCIAIAMIVMLVFFLNDLVTQAEETRLLLARLLIQLQVLHSFDLPRRRDLGYSIVIGMILLGVAGTISQTTIFGIWLLLFLVVGVPVLILDHRSRLGVTVRSFNPTKIGLSPKTTIGLLAVILALGMTIFLFLPRLPGFQLRNFPVSVNMNIERQLRPGQILERSNSFGNQNDLGSGGTSGTGDETGEEGDQPLLPALFAEEIDEVGANTEPLELEPELVMRVRSQAELFWRVISYDRYTGTGWQISRNDETDFRTLRRLAYGYQFFVPSPLGIPIRVEGTKDVIQTYTITTEEFPNLVPAAATPIRLFFPSKEMDLDAEGSLRAPGPLPLDLTYTVISSVPIRDRTALAEAPQEYPSFIRDYYLQLPEDENEVAQIKQVAAALLADARTPAGSPMTLDNPYDQALWLTQSLKQRYRLQNFIYFPGIGSTAVQFLNQGGGQPSHFLSALIMLLRSQGIPARYTVGFAPGDFNAFTGLYEVENIDAIAVAEVYFPEHGWIAFDPVPGRPLFPPSVEVSQTFGVLRKFWNWVAGFLPSPVTAFFSVMFANLLEFLGDKLEGLINWLAGMGWFSFIASILMFFGFGIAGWSILQLWNWWRRQSRLRRMEPTQRIYQLMLQWLEEQGISKAASQTPAEYAAYVKERVSHTQAEKIDLLTQAYQDWHYGDRPANLNQLKSLLNQLRGSKLT